MGSNLVNETDTSLEIEEYLHNDNSFYPDWVLFGEYPEELVSALSNVLYEVRVRYILDKSTLKATLISIDGSTT